MKSQALTLVVTLILLGFALVAVVINALSVMRAVTNLRQQHTLVKAEDVSTVRPWMTISYVAHSYEVPETYLDQSLHITSHTPRFSTLHDLALQSKRTPTEYLHQVQRVITTYKKLHGKAHPPHPGNVKPVKPKHTVSAMKNEWEITA